MKLHETREVTLTGEDLAFLVATLENQTKRFSQLTVEEISQVPGGPQTVAKLQVLICYFNSHIDR